MATPAGGDPRETLAGFLTRRARSASDLRLTLDLTGGAIVALAAALWQPRGWVSIFAAACCFATFAVWAMADRELRERAESRGSAMALLRVGRGFAALIGVLAAVTFVVSILFAGLGRWIS